MSTVNEQREIILEGAYNMRDLGHLETSDGYQLKPGKLFRADALHNLTDTDLELIGRLGIESVIDLRSDNEIEKTGPARMTEQGARYLHMPVMGGDPAKAYSSIRPDSLGKVYTLLAERSADKFVGVIEALSTRGNQPAVFHCAAGKDRTGITAALLYSMLNVEREAIIADYVITDGNMMRMREQLLADRPELAEAHAAEAAKYPSDFLRAEDSTIRTFLGELDEQFGSPVEWLLKSGLQESSIENLRQEMLG